MIPIGDDQVKNGYFPLFSRLFLGLNIAIFIYQISLNQIESQTFTLNFAVIPVDILHFTNLYSLATSLFMHGGLMHLLGNMLFLYVFADNIESTVGSFYFVLFYLIGGLLATFGHILVDPYSQTPLIGASGAISATLGAYLVMYPSSRVKLFFLFFTLRVPAVLFLLFWIGQQWISGINSIKGNVSDNVAWWAHIAGFGYGVAVGWFFRGNFPRKQLGN